MQDSVRRYMKEISIAMLLQIQSDIYIYIYIYIYMYTKNNEKRKSSLLLHYAFHRCCGSSGIAKCFY